MTTGLVDSLLGSANDILGVRDSIGAALKAVKIVTRTWSGGRVGSGTSEDTAVDVLPSPGFKSFAHDLRLQEGGEFKQGDILLTSISKQTFPTEAEVRAASGGEGVEKFYRVGGEDYRVISIVEKHLTWNVQLRKITNQGGA